jgi:hypothetical protein
MSGKAKITAAPKFVLPVSWKHAVTSGLGDPRPYGSHEGVDLAPTEKLDKYPVYATAGGRVLDAGFQADGYGYFVKIDHGGGFQSIYGHFESPPAVAKGDTVSQGQVIGHAGSTGYSTGRHLHFSLLKDGEYLNPLEWVGDAVESARTFLSETVSRILQNDPCAGYADDQVQWITCRLAHGLPDDPDSYMDTFEQWAGLDETEQLELRTATRESIKKESEGSSIKEAISGLFDDVKEWVTSGVTFPFRAFVNTFKLSETPLTGGKDTIAFLQAPENQRVVLATSAALVIAIVLLIVVFAQFVKEPAQQIVKVGAETVANAVVE